MPAAAMDIGARTTNRRCTMEMAWVAAGAVSLMAQRRCEFPTVIWPMMVAEQLGVADRVHSFWWPSEAVSCRRRRYRPGDMKPAHRQLRLDWRAAKH